MSLGVLSALVLVVSVNARDFRWKWINRGIIVITLVTTDSRTGFVGAVAGIFITLVLANDWSVRRRLVVGACLIASLPFVTTALSTVRLSGQSNLSGRDVIWDNSLNIAEQAGLFGFGPGAIARYFPEVGGAGSSISQAQNQWINDWINFGLVGGVLIATLVGSLLVIGAWERRHVGVVPLVGAVAVMGFSEIPVNLWSSTVQAVPLFVLIVVAPRPGRHATQRRSALSDESASLGQRWEMER